MIEEEYRINNSPGAKEAFEKLGAYIADRLDDDVVGEKLASVAGRVPTLLIWGAEDKTVALSIGEAAQKLLGNPPLAVIAGAAHTSYYENAEAFNRVLLEFLGGKPRSHAIAGVTWR
jgi:2-hydroxy-6-oxonona-2,4-dienedioate hydrolase